MSNTIETRQSQEKLVPKTNQIGYILKQIERDYGPEIPGIICDLGTALYSPNYFGWEINRKERSKEVVGNAKFGTGFEGFVVADPIEDRFKFQAMVGYEALDNETRENPYQPSRRNALERMLYHDRDVSLNCLAPLYGI